MRLKIDQASSPGEIGEGAPFAGDERRVVAVPSRADDARVLVEGKSDVGFKRQARALEDYFWGHFAHICNYIHSLTLQKNSNNILKRFVCIVVVYSR